MPERQNQVKSLFDPVLRRKPEARSGCLDQINGTELLIIVRDSRHNQTPRMGEKKEAGPWTFN